LEYAIRRVQDNQQGLKLNGTHEVLAYADDANIVAENIHNHIEKHRSSIRHKEGGWCGSESRKN
jgi:hypothetical protein